MGREKELRMNVGFGLVVALPFPEAEHMQEERTWGLGPGQADEFVVNTGICVCSGLRHGLLGAAHVQ